MHEQNSSSESEESVESVESSEQEQEQLISDSMISQENKRDLIKEFLETLLFPNMKISKRLDIFTSSICKNIFGDDSYLRMEIKKIKKQWRNKMPSIERPLCRQKLDHQLIAFYCFDCMNERNSSICKSCFNNGNHKNHHYEQIKPKDGYCSCGDHSKWKNRSFCKNHHGFHKQKHIQIDQKMQQKFEQIMMHAMYILIELYFKSHQFLENNVQYFNDNNHNNNVLRRKKKIQNIADFYGKMLIKFLIDMASESYFSTMMVHKLLHKSFSESKSYKNQIKILKPTLYGKQLKIINILGYLYSMPLFENISYKVEQLSEILFTVQHFRKEVALVFINNSKNIPFYFNNNKFVQIFKKAISDSSTVQQLLQQQKQNCILDINYTKISHIRLTYNLSILVCSEEYLKCLLQITKIKEKISFQYFNLHFSVQNISEIAKYKVLINSEINLQQIYKGVEIQLQYLLTMIQITKILRKDATSMKKSMKDLFTFINSNKKVIDEGLIFRPQERTFAIMVFSFYGGDLKMLDNPQIMQDLIEMLGIKSICSDLMFQKLSIFYNIQAKQIVKRSEQSQNDFFKQITKDDKLMLSLDSIFVKIIIKINTFLIQKHQGSKGNKHSPLIEPLSITNNYELLQKKLKCLSELGGWSQQCASLLDQFIFSISLHVEAISSNLPELVLKSYLQIQNQFVLQEFTCFYQSLLAIFGKIQIKQFQNICQVFLKNQAMFNSYIKMKVQSNQKLHSNTIQSKPESKMLNLSYYFLHNFQIYQVKNSSSTREKICPFQKTLSFNFCYENYKIIENLMEILKILLKIQNPVAKEYLNKFVIFVWSINKLMKKQEQFVVKYKAIFYKINLKNLEQTQIANEIHEYLERKCQLNQDNSQIQPIKKRGTKITIEIMKKEVLQERIQEKKIEIEENQKRFQLKKEQMLEKNRMASETTLRMYEAKQEKDEELRCIICKSAERVSKVLAFPCYVQKSNLYDIFKSQKQQFLVFTSCSAHHAVHLECIAKIEEEESELDQLEGNRMKPCRMCQFQINYYMPVNVRQYYDTPDLITSLIEDFYFYHFKSLLQFKKYNERKLFNQLFLSVQVQVIFSGLLNHQFFHDKMKHLYRSILQILQVAAFFNKIQRKDLKNIFNFKLQSFQLNRQCEEIFEYTQLVLKRHIFIQINNQNAIQEEKQQKNFDCLRKIIKNIFSVRIKNSSKLKEIIQNTPIQNILRKMIKIRSLQNNLKELNNKYKGNCPNCKRLTDHMFCCLLCDFKTCNCCNKISLQTHSNDLHANLTMFIDTSLGEICYASNGYQIFQKPIYLNFRSDAFQMKDEEDQEGNVIQRNNNGNIQRRKQDYFRSEKKEKEVIKTIFNFEIRQMLRGDYYDYL